MSLTASLRRGGILLTLLALPFYVPVLIFGTGAVAVAAAAAAAAAAQGFPATGQLALLGAYLVLALPLAISAGLPISRQ